MAAGNDRDGSAAARIIALAARPAAPGLRDAVAAVAADAAALLRRLRPGLIRRLLAPTAPRLDAEGRAATLAERLAALERPLREEMERLRGSAAILAREGGAVARAGRLGAQAALECAEAHAAFRDAAAAWQAAYRTGKNLVPATKNLASVAAMLAGHGFADEDAEE
jgi:hypothetical protein